MSGAKTIELYLLDGDPLGIIKAKLSNWPGIVYKIPKIELDSCSTRNGDISKHINQAGIYFLLGESENGRPSIYIGQANARKNNKGLIQRLNEHKNDKNEWNQVIIVTRLIDSFEATDLNYLENKYTTLAIDVNRYEVINNVEPSRGNISEEKISELDEFAKSSYLIFGILGIKPFEKVKASYDNSKVEQVVFKSQFGPEASGTITNQGFILLKGSKINPTLSPSVKESTRNLRDQYSSYISNDYLTTDNLIFNSQSAAASFVTGSPTSGNLFWKTKDGKTPKDF